MTAPNIEAEYVEWKMVKTRKSLQLIFEVPLEMQAAVQQALGTPMPDASPWVVIVPFVKGIQQEADDEPTVERPARPLSQLAAFMCTRIPFRRFLAERISETISGESEAATVVRRLCGIASRKELDTNEVAARHWRNLKADYDLWMSGKAEAA